METVLVTGAAGGVGHRLCRVLRRHGFEVRGLVRPEDDARRLELAPEDLSVGYVQDAGLVDRAMRGVDTVVHCAALLPGALAGGTEPFRVVNVEGTRTVVHHAMIHRVRRVIVLSTISVVDHVTRTVTPAELLDYDGGGVDAYVASKIEAEKLCLAMGREFEGRLAILRLAYVYGPGNFAVWRQPLRLLELGKLRLIGNGAAPLPLVFADDVAEFVAASIGSAPAPARPAIHVLANPQPTTLRTVFDAIADHLGVTRPGSVPVWAARLAAALVSRLPAGCRQGRLGLLTPARVRQFSRGYDLSAVADREFLARVRLTDYREGLRLMLEDYVASERGAPPR